MTRRKLQKTIKAPDRLKRIFAQLSDPDFLRQLAEMWMSLLDQSTQNVFKIYESLPSIWAVGWAFYKSASASLQIPRSASGLSETLQYCQDLQYKSSPWPVVENVVLSLEKCRASYLKTCFTQIATKFGKIDLLFSLKTFCRSWLVSFLHSLQKLGAGCIFQMFYALLYLQNMVIIMLRDLNCVHLVLSGLTVWCGGLLSMI